MEAPDEARCEAREPLPDELKAPLGERLDADAASPPLDAEEWALVLGGEMGVDEV